MSTIRFRSIAWMITGVMLSMILLVLFQAWQADAAVDDGESAFQPITPCRLMDTRPSGFDNVGPRATPIGADETYLVQVTGTNGDCTIPADATGVALNMIALNATAPSFLQVWPADATQPVRGSNLNYDQNSPPLPNKVDVKLSATGAVNIYNLNGTVDVVGDVVGYYTNLGLQDLDSRVGALEAAPDTAAAVLARLDALEADVNALEAANAALASDVAALETDVAALETKLESVSIETVDGHPTVRLTGVNLQIVDGSGDTAGPVNGRGNLIVGYNENSADTRSGSHSVVVGERHSFSSYGSILGGFNNAVTAPNSSVTGGRDGVASGFFSSIAGGFNNQASGTDSSVAGGEANQATAATATVAGGSNNEANSQGDAVAGGFENVANGGAATISGGRANSATGVFSSVSGGNENTASNEHASVSGGTNGTASGAASSVTGGDAAVASGSNAVVVGGGTNSASGAFSIVVGGGINQATGVTSVVTGGNSNVADAGQSVVSGGSGRVVTALGGDGFDWVGGSLFESF